MDTKVALLIIYNHRFDRNIPKLEKIYEGRFNNIFHVIPFYDGDVKNVIPVYENSFYFEGYVAQAFQQIKDKGFTHFFIVADDMIINPDINEDSLWDCIGIEKEDCLMVSKFGWKKLQDTNKKWLWIFNALNYRVKTPGVEISAILPSKEEAQKKFDKLNLPYSKLPIRSILKNFSISSAKTLKKDIEHIRRSVKLFNWNRTLDYPMIGGYSDIFLITSDNMKQFATYCGAFAATNLFVEIAIPTAMALSCDSIKLISDTKYRNGAMWSDKDRAFLDSFDNSIQKLQQSFPKDLLFLHPIKLSKWV
jgi:hypothetical protein